MTPQIFVATALAPALTLLPPHLDTPEARAMVLAIALQESGLEARRQLGGGPARSYLQFETAGIRGVLKHEQSAALAKALCLALDIRANYPAIYRAIEFHDVLTVGLGRLLLRQLPRRLPGEAEPDEAYLQYMVLWRPGKPRPDDWPGNHRLAWSVIRGET